MNGYEKECYDETSDKAWKKSRKLSAVKAEDFSNLELASMYHDHLLDRYAKLFKGDASPNDIPWISNETSTATDSFSSYESYDYSRESRSSQVSLLAESWMDDGSTSSLRMDNPFYTARSNRRISAGSKGKVCNARECDILFDSVHRLNSHPGNVALHSLIEWERSRMNELRGKGDYAAAANQVMKMIVSQRFPKRLRPLMKLVWSKNRDPKYLYQDDTMMEWNELDRNDIKIRIYFLLLGGNVERVYGFGSVAHLGIEFDNEIEQETPEKPDGGLTSMIETFLFSAESFADYVPIVLTR
mmetsp:Transcript_22019/g.50238  ORF Transcript_22019/g.50238 Transcript_22019/m.50238 type:complete len:300 (+) Transcript_22019:1940-2839(+)